MEHTELKKQNIQGISVVRDNERTFTCTISTDAHASGTNTFSYALGLVYVKALLAGCDGYTRGEFLSAVGLLGASVSVSFSNNMVHISFSCIDTHAQKLLKLIEAMLTKPRFESKELKRIKELLQNELEEEKDDARSASVRLFSNTLYTSDDRRYIPTPEETAKKLPEITKKNVQAFHAHVLSGVWNYTLVGAPAIETHAKKKLLSWRSAFLSSTRAVLVQQTVTLDSRTVQLESIPSKQNIEFSIGGSLPLYLTQKEYYGFLFGLQVLGKWGGFTGRLMSTVREKEGLTYGIYARTEEVRSSEYGHWRIMTFFAPDKAIQGLHSTLREIDLIRKKGITQEEYTRFKTILSTSQTLLQDSILRTAGDLHAYQIKGLSLEEIAAHKKKLLAVTKEEVNEALKIYLDDSKLVICGAGPIATVEKDIKALAKSTK